MAEMPEMKIDFEVDVEKIARPLRRLAIALEIAATDEVLAEKYVAQMERTYGSMEVEHLRVERAEWLQEVQDTLLRIEWFDRKIVEIAKADQP